MKKWKLAFVCLVLSAVPLTALLNAQAEMVSYVDENGQRHLVNTDFATVPPQYADQVKSDSSPWTEPGDQTGESVSADDDSAYGDSAYAPSVVDESVQDAGSENFSGNFEPVPEDIPRPGLTGTFPPAPPPLPAPSGKVPGDDAPSPGNAFLKERPQENDVPLPEDVLPGDNPERWPPSPGQMGGDSFGAEFQAPVLVEVALYTMTGCRACLNLEMELKAHGVNFSRYDIGVYREKKKFLLQRLGENPKLPVVGINQDILMQTSRVSDVIKKILETARVDKLKDVLWAN